LVVMSWYPPLAPSLILLLRLGPASSIASSTGLAGGARSSASGGSEGSPWEGEEGGADGAGGFPGGGGGWTALGCGVTGKAAPLATRWGGGVPSGEVGEAP
jgi:hypothetical protein